MTRGYLALPFLVLFLLLAGTSGWDKSVTYDEPAHYEYGERILDGGTIEADMQRMPATAGNVLPVSLAERLFGTLPQQGRIRLARLVTVGAAALLGWLVFAWARQLYGWRAGLFSVGLYTLSPNILAHSRLVTGDLYCAGAMLLAAYCFVRYLRDPTLPTLAAVAVVTGAAQLTKQTAVLLIPVFAAVWLAHERGPIRGPRARAAVACLHATSFLLIVMLVILAGYRFQGAMLPVRSYDLGGSLLGRTVAGFPELPVPLPRAYVDALVAGQRYNAEGTGHGSNYLFGRVSRFGWWYYFPVALALKTPLAISILFVWTAVRWRRRPPVLDEWVLLAMAAAVFAFFVLLCTAQIGVRYLLPLLPCAHVLSGSLLSDRGRLRPNKTATVAIAALAAWYAISSLSYYPHYLSYFNELIGDRKNMYRYLADSNVDWGQNDRYLDRYLERHRDRPIAVEPAMPTTGTVVVSVNNLVGIRDRGRMAWLRKYEPVDHIAYSWLVFEVPTHDPAPEPNRAPDVSD